MSLYKRKDSSTWWVNIYRGKGLKRVQVSTGTADRKKAETIESMIRSAQAQTLSRDNLISQIDELLETKKTGIPLGMAWEIYAGLDEVKAGRETMRKRRIDFNRLVDWLKESYPRVETLEQITREIAFAFADYERSRVTRGKTWTNERANLASMFQSMMIRAGLVENVWRLVPAGDHSDSESGRAFTVDEERRILAACKEFGKDWYGASLVARYTGLRYSDIVFLRWDQITDRIALEPGKTKRHGIKVGIPIHPVLAEFFSTRERDGEFVFRSHIDRYKSSQRRTEFSKILELAGVDGGLLSFHCWRHTFRTRLSEAGVSKDLAQRLGGWTTDVSELYNHDFEGLKKAVEAMK